VWRLEASWGGEEERSLITMAGARRFEAARGSEVFFRFKEAVGPPEDAALAPLEAGNFPLLPPEASFLPRVRRGF
jgi:hypothetical protein